MVSRPLRRIGLIGHGQIGRAVADAVAAGQAGAWEMAAILTRNGAAGSLHHGARKSFFEVPVDLYLECAGPQALTQLGEAALMRADVWSVSGVALADAVVYARLQAAGARHGHRLRLVAGAVGGLDAVQALAVDPAVCVDVTVVAPGGAASFTASARDAAVRLPHGVNVAVAVAVAGAGLDRTMVQYTSDRDPSSHAIGVRARSAYGAFESRLLPTTDARRGLHVVAASLLAALRQADQVIWSG